MLLSSHASAAFLWGHFVEINGCCVVLFCVNHIWLESTASLKAWPVCAVLFKYHQFKRVSPRYLWIFPHKKCKRGGQRKLHFATNPFDLWFRILEMIIQSLKKAVTRQSVLLAETQWSQRCDKRAVYSLRVFRALEKATSLGATARPLLHGSVCAGKGSALFPVFSRWITVNHVQCE